MGRKAKKALAAKKVPDATAVPAKPASAAMKAKAAPRVILFYSDRPGNQFREFSNFFKEAPPFCFLLPLFAQREGWPKAVQCEFAEKAIMLTKAALMGDAEMFAEIQSATDPKTCKALGRGVRDFDQDLWDTHLDEVAFEVVRQKFESSEALSAVLRKTGDSILAEAAPNDCIWGIGLRINDDRALDPQQWCGRNVLGQALVKARAHLRGDQATSAPDGANAAVTVSAGTGAAAGATAATATGSAASMAGTSPVSAGTAAPRLPLIPKALDVEEDFLRPISDLAAVRACYEEFGVVGVTGVLSPEECHILMRDGLEPHLPCGCSMEDPATFSLADPVMNRHGVIGKAGLFSPALLAARLHPNVAAAYSSVHGRDDVFAGHDRAAWMRPAGLDPAWVTPYSWPGLHVDISPLGYFDSARSVVDAFLRGVDYRGNDFVAENNAKHVSMGRTVQGVLNLLDNEHEDGGFQCVPGMFGPALREWVHAHGELPAPEANGRYGLRAFGRDASLGKQAVRVPCPAGTLILFDATLPHGTRPNASMRSRAILFLRYLTSEELPTEAWHARNAALRRVAARVGFQPDARQARHLYGPEAARQE